MNLIIGKCKIDINPFIGKDVNRLGFQKRNNLKIESMYLVTKIRKKIDENVVQKLLRQRML